MCVGSAMILVMFFYLYIKGRYGLNRVDMPILLGSFLFILSPFTARDVSDSGNLLWSVALLLLTSGLFLYAADYYQFWRFTPNSFSVRKFKEVREDRVLMDYINSNNDKIYMIDTSSTYPGKGFNFWEPYPEGYCSNAIWLGGWFTGSPIQKAQWAINDVENPILELIENDDCYYVDNTGNVSIILEYIRQHYHENTDVEPVYQSGSYTVYFFWTW